MKLCSKCRRWVPVLLGLLWAPGYCTGGALWDPRRLCVAHTRFPMQYIPAKGRPEEGIRANHPRANLPQPLLRVDVG